MNTEYIKLTEATKTLIPKALEFAIGAEVNSGLIYGFSTNIITIEAGEKLDKVSLTKLRKASLTGLPTEPLYEFKVFASCPTALKIENEVVWTTCHEENPDEWERVPKGDRINSVVRDALAGTKITRFEPFSWGLVIHFDESVHLILLLTKPDTTSQLLLDLWGDENPGKDEFFVSITDMRTDTDYMIGDGVFEVQQLDSDSRALYDPITDNNNGASPQ